MKIACNMRIFTVIIISSVMLCSCSSSLVTFPDDYSDEILMISTGGGVSGMWTTWYILSNGKTFIKEGIEGTPKYLKKISPGKRRACFDLIHELDLKNQPFVHPGNMTYLLGLKHGKNQWEIKWGDPGVQTPGAYMKAYQSILECISQ